MKAALALAAGEKDARARVALACEILRPISQRDFSDKRDWDEIQEIMSEAGRYGPLTNSDGRMLQTAFAHTAKVTYNSTASRLALRIFKLYLKDNGIEI